MQIKQVVTRSSANGRSVNEDAVLYVEDASLIAVADGMGGEGAGDIAAALSFEHLQLQQPFLVREIERVAESRTARARFNINRLLEVAFECAHKEVSRQAQVTGRRRMATALLSVLIAGDHAHISHVGNCRAYMLRRDRLHLLTQDHTVAAARRTLSSSVDRDPSERRRLLQVLGTGNIDVDLAEVPLADDDVLLLCTDGLSHPLSEERLQEILTSSSLEQSADALLAAAEEAGDDNIAFSLIRVGAAQDSSSVDEIAELMRSVFLFRELNTAERYLLAPFLEERRYAEGDVIIHEGHHGAEFYVIIEGAVRITRNGVHLVDIGVGGHLGELTLARPSIRSATVTATEPVRVYSLTRDRFLKVSERRPGLGTRLSLSLLDTVGQRLRDLTERLAQTEQLLKSTPDDHDALLAAIRGESR